MKGQIQNRILISYMTKSGFPLHPSAWRGVMKKIIGMITAVALLFVMGCSDDHGTPKSTEWLWQERIFAPPVPVGWQVVASSADGTKLITTVFGGHIYTGEYF